MSKLFTYEKYLTYMLTLRFRSNMPLDHVTAEGYADLIKGMLEEPEEECENHTVVEVIAAESCPSQKDRLLNKLHELDCTIQQLRRDLTALPEAVVHEKRTPSSRPETALRSDSPSSDGTPDTGSSAGTP